jgi:hypothetical protein
MIKALSCIVLIVGLLKFAQEAPDLFKKIFSAGGDLLSGIKLDPRAGMKDMGQAIGRTGSAISGAIGGFAGGVSRSIQNAGADYDAQGHGRHGAIGRGIHVGLASITGGARGLISGGVNGIRHGADSPTPHNMYEQLMSGVDRGQTTAMEASQRYRDGDSTNVIGRVGRRIGHGAVDFAEEHIARPTADFMETLEGGRNLAEAAEMHNRMKANNEAVLAATGGKNDDDDLKAAKNSALGKIREAKAMGANARDVLRDLGIDNFTYEDAQGNKVDAFVNDQGELVTHDGRTFSGNEAYKQMERIIKENYNNQKTEMLRSKFNGLSDQRLDAIRQYNEETIRDFESHMTSLSTESMTSMIKAMDEKMSLNLVDNAGNLTQDVNSSMRTILEKLNTINNQQLQSNGAELMNYLNTMQTQMNKINQDIVTTRTLQEHQRANRHHGNNNNGGNNGGSNGNSGGNGGH